MNQKQIKPHKGHLCGAILLICAISLGSGILSLSLLESIPKVMPTSLMLLMSWLFALGGGLLFVEANLWVAADAHIIKMSQKLLNPFYKWVLMWLYLFTSYLFLILFVAKGAQVLFDDVSTSHLILNPSSICLLMGLFLGSSVYLGILSVSRINALLFGIATCLAIIYFGKFVFQTHLKNEVLGKAFSLSSIPFFFSAFSFQTILPTLTVYLKGHEKSLRLAVIWGSISALTIYILWAVQKNSLNLATLNDANHFFIFLILICAFLGISMGLFDFLAEGLNESKRGWHKVRLTLLISIPTLIAAIFFSNFFCKLFVVQVRYVAPILYGVMPALLVFKKRKLTTQKRKWDGIALIIGAAFVFMLSWIKS